MFPPMQIVDFLMRRLKCFSLVYCPDLSFRFIERDGEVIMKFKHWHADEDWKPLNGEKVHILKVDENGQQTLQRDFQKKVKGKFQ